MIKYLRRMAIAYVAMLVCSAAALSMLGQARLPKGCYSSDALLWGAECSGFTGSSMVAFVLNMPLNLIYAPILGVIGLFERPFHTGTLYALMVGIALWAPIAFLLWSKAVSQARA